MPQYVDEMVEKIREKFADSDLSVFPQKLAVQVNLKYKKEEPAPLYIEVLNGVLSVMPYEYIDRDAAIEVGKTELTKLINTKKYTFAQAIEDGKVVVVDGSADAVKMLDLF